MAQHHQVKSTMADNMHYSLGRITPDDLALCDYSQLGGALQYRLLLLAEIGLGTVVLILGFADRSRIVRKPLDYRQYLHKGSLLRSQFECHFSGSFGPPGAIET